MTLIYGFMVSAEFLIIPYTEGVFLNFIAMFSVGKNLIIVTLGTMIHSGTLIFRSPHTISPTVVVEKAYAPEITHGSIILKTPFYGKHIDL